MRRLTTIVILAVTAAALAAAVPAAAEGEGSGWIDDEGTPVAEAARRITAPGRRGAASVCVYERLPLPPGAVVHNPDGTPIRPAEPGTWYIRRCRGPDGTEISNEAVFVGAVDPRQLAQQTMRSLPLARPAVNTSPPAGTDQLVGVPTWLWVGGAWEPASATAAVPGVAVTVTAVPVSVTWRMGNGDSVACRGPGTVYDTGRPAAEQTTDCSYTYRRSSAGQPGTRYRVTATITWDVSWSAVGTAGGGDLGTVTRSTTFALRVAQAQALITQRRAGPWLAL